jgi:hypothetical protein
VFEEWREEVMKKLILVAALMMPGTVQAGESYTVTINRMCQATLVELSLTDSKWTVGRIGDTCSCFTRELLHISTPIQVEEFIANKLSQTVMDRAANACIYELARKW